MKYGTKETNLDSKVILEDVEDFLEGETGAEDEGRKE